MWQIPLEEMLQRFLSERNLQVDCDAMIQEWLEYDSIIDPEVFSLIESLEKQWYLCYAASNQESRRAEYLQNELWFEKLFQHMFFSCDLFVAKPEWKFYEKIVNELWVKENEIIYFDDDEKNVSSARVIWINSYLCTEAEDILEKIKLHE